MYPDKGSSELDDDPDGCSSQGMMGLSPDDTGDESGDGDESTDRKRKQPGEEAAEDSKPPLQKKVRFIWAGEPHSRFLASIKAMVDRNEKPVPNKILKEMNMEGVTRENVASHLQKFRIQKRKEQEREAARLPGCTSPDVGPSNFYPVASEFSRSPYATRNTLSAMYARQMGFGSLDPLQLLPPLPNQLDVHPAIQDIYGTPYLDSLSDENVHRVRGFQVEDPGYFFPRLDRRHTPNWRAGGFSWAPSHTVRHGGAAERPPILSPREMPGLGQGTVNYSRPGDWYSEYGGSMCCPMEEPVLRGGPLHFPTEAPLLGREPLQVPITAPASDGESFTPLVEEPVQVGEAVQCPVEAPGPQQTSAEGSADHLGLMDGDLADQQMSYDNSYDFSSLLQELDVPDFDKLFRYN